jgi:hypothetical protein
MRRFDRHARVSLQGDDEVRIHKTMFAMVLAALVAATLALPPSAVAQTPPGTAPKLAMPADRMTVQEAQGIGCLIAGAVGAFGAFYYSDVLTIAVTSGIVPAAGLPSIPFIVGGFVTTCGIGATLTPTVLHFMGMGY